MNDDNVHNLELRFISNIIIDGMIYNQPNIYEVATLIVGDVDTIEKKDIIMQTKVNNFKE